MTRFGSCLSLAAALATIAMTAPAGAQTKPCAGLRALNGQCANPAVVRMARLRAMIMTTERLSYFGTPVGEVGGPFIPEQRFYRDKANLFTLPTFTRETDTAVRRVIVRTITRTK
jgi:hypothetical protein